MPTLEGKNNTTNKERRGEKYHNFVNSQNIKYVWKIMYKVNLNLVFFDEINTEFRNIFSRIGQAGRDYLELRDTY